MKKDDNLSRSFSGATQFNNLLKSEKKINYQKQINNKNIPDTKYKINNNENKLINIAQNKLIINNDTNSENHTKILKSKTNTNKTKTNFKKRKKKIKKKKKIIKILKIIKKIILLLSFLFKLMKDILMKKKKKIEEKNKIKFKYISI